MAFTKQSAESVERDEKILNSLRECRENGSGLTALAKTVGCTPQHVQSAMKRFIRDGKAKNEGCGIYTAL